ncbi:AAA family ATPase [Nocardia noduli]|uniref:AAA family ATPase n=1 Tax=Nocardia noduli TaxID=2815722 RepID=UPI0020B2F2E1|nr:AAA family ATPase [Nocardia noduli]
MPLAFRDESKLFPDFRYLDPLMVRDALNPHRFNEVMETLGHMRVTYEHSGRPGAVAIGSLKYTGGSSSRIDIWTGHHQDADEYGLDLPAQRRVEGIFLPAHRSISPYRPVERIPAKFVSAEEILRTHVDELRNIFYSYNSPGGRSTPMLRMKEALLAAAVFGEGNSSVRPNPEALDVWHGFQQVLRAILPDSIGFIRLEASPPDIILETSAGRYAIDAISGGMNTLFDLAWQIHLRSRNSAVFTVCIDEPENHLHPSLQRTLIPNLMRAFPEVKFVLATHSPFIVTAAPEAKVYVLTYDEDNSVNSTALDFENKAQSAERTLTDVLGLATTTPVWAEDLFNAIMSRFVEREISSESMWELKNELERNGLGHELPFALEQLLGERE